MRLSSAFCLQAMNTLAVPCVAEHFCQADTLDVLRAALGWAQQRSLPVHILGGGSNVVLPCRLQGLVLAPVLLGRQIVSEQGGRVQVRFGAGENWHAVVDWCLRQRLYGLENLAMIPGNVGAAPVQNIGAYGVELADCFVQLEALDRQSLETRLFDFADCQFAYRDSVFKNAQRERLIITQVTLELSRTPVSRLEYPALREALAGCAGATPVDIYHAVCRLRTSKLPDPAVLPNCGSFFKNPLISAAQLQALRTQYPDAVAFATPDPQTFKLAAAWLIDRSGWKGQSVQGAAVHAQQALVLTNPQRGAADQVLALAQAIRLDIQARFNIELEMEPQLPGWTHPAARPLSAVGALTSVANGSAATDAV